MTRVLLLRLERIGDLLMTLDAIAEARAIWPAARIDLAVGSWNEPLARLIPEITTVDIADVPWLARDRAGDGWPALVSKARAWRRQAYDVVINFEPDIRTNFLAWIAGAPVARRIRDGRRRRVSDRRAPVPGRRARLDERRGTRATGGGRRRGSSG